MSVAGGGLERLLISRVPATVRRILDNCLANGGGAVSREDGTLLLSQRESGAVAAIAACADELRRRRNGDVATYVVNRNIQFTNVCVKRCGFCAFSRNALVQAKSADGESRGHEEGYFMPVEEVARRAEEAASLGATEICAQAGLPPAMSPTLYEDIARAIKEAAPKCHLHAFSPEEVLYGARVSGRSLPEMLRALRDAGVDSLPGTSAEILDDDVRRRLAATRLTTQQWMEVVQAAHEEGIPTTSTIMFGHIESPAHVALHFDILRAVQTKALARGGPGRLSELVPLSFVSAEAPMFQKGTLHNCRPGPSGLEVVLVHAVARIMLDSYIDHIQASWVKEGPRMTQVLLQAGVDDLGGTLINESISTAAGAKHGQRMAPAELRRLAREAGRTPVQRSTTYQHLRIFDDKEGSTQNDAEDEAAWQQGDARFGSYKQLTDSASWRFSAEMKRRRQHGQSRPFSTSLQMRSFASGTAKSDQAAEPNPTSTPTMSSPSKVVTYSPSYTVVPTFECFNACAYCNFRARKGEPRAEWMKLGDVDATLTNLERQGAAVREILVLAGEVHPGSRRRAPWLQLAVETCRMARSKGFLPHTNIGPLSRSEMQALGAENASMGLMLEQSSQRIYEAKDGPYAKGAPSKEPSLRLQQLEIAGELRIPFTTGLLLGIGETDAEIEATIDDIATVARKHGHIQECIIQPYRPGHSDTWKPDPARSFELERLPSVVALARERLPAEVAVQIPPNLVEGHASVLFQCLEAGARDLGGISPRDEVNPDYLFPSVSSLTRLLQDWGYTLQPREAVHDRLAQWAFGGAGLDTLAPAE